MVPAPLNAWQQRATNPAVVEEIARLLDHHTCQQIASILNERGLCSGEGKTFSVRIVARIQKRYGLMPRCDRLRKAGMLTVKEMAALFGVTPQWVKVWHRHGLVCGHAYNDKNDCLYEHPGDNPPRKAQGVKLSPWILGAPQREFARLIFPIRSRTSGGITRPTGAPLLFQAQ